MRNPFYKYGELITEHFTYKAKKNRLTGTVYFYHSGWNKAAKDSNLKWVFR